jgi:ABC-2 type transport system ATP-binding protein
MTAPVATSDVARAFGDETAVDGVDLEVHNGEIHAIVGLNGAGKTTLMRLLLGMLRPDRGRATVMGFDALDAPSSVWRDVGHLIEQPFAYPELTVRENLRASAVLHALSPPALDADVEDAIEMFELGKWADRRAGTLSLGNRQRLGLASALVHRPQIVILDEPANALDPAGIVFIRDLLQRLAGNDAVVLVSSHHFDQLARVADTITVMHRGRVVGSLDPGGVDLEQRFFDLVHRADLAWGANRR